MAPIKGHFPGDCLCYTPTCTPACYHTA